jgi:hypothetical protein
MGRNASDIYSIPPGTEGIPDTTIESNKYNAFIHDVETDLNTPRPIVAGGTGENNATDALSALGGEKSSQLVTNYDTHVWLPGSFYSAAGATGAPVAGHAFVGLALSSDAPAVPPANLNVVLYARDQTDTTVPQGRVYVRQKKAGTWEPWTVDGTGVASTTPPPLPSDNMLWWNSTDGHLYIYYNDGNTSQWVVAAPYPDPAQFLRKTGDVMSGSLTLLVPPIADQHAATKKYVDDAIAAAIAALP